MGEKMNYKVIIADDELLECKVLEKMLSENLQNLEILPYALNGIELIAAVEKNTPDIVIVDINMPGINGLDAIELILNKYKNIKVLVVSAYSKFEYAQKALFLGATDYLLKPVKEPDILKTFQKICNQIDQEQRAAEEKRDMNLKLKDYEETVENEFMTSLLLDDLTMECVQKYREIMLHSFYGAFLICIEGKEMQADIYRNILVAMKRISTCSGRIQKKMLILCVFPSQLGTVEEYKRWLRINLECIIKSKIETTEMFIAVSQYKIDIGKLAEGYQESRRVLMQMRNPGICFYGNDSNNKERQCQYAEKETCREFARQGQYDMVLDTLQDIIDYSKKSGEYLNDFKILVLDIMHIILSVHNESHEVMLTRWIYWKDILASVSYTDVFRAVEKTLEELKDEKKNNLFNRYVTSSLQYIASHYYEEIDLDKVADQNGISSFYLSRLFKQEVRFTFIEILTNVRLSKVIEFMFEGEYSAQQLSEKCGYMNTSYFYKVFKKQTGMTFGEMKNYIGKE